MKGNKMSKKTHWTHVADNALFTVETPERKRKLFKWGLAIDRMPLNKPKFNKTKKLEVSEEE